MTIYGSGLGNKGLGGGSLVVMRSAAVAGQTVRVVFNRKPLARSPIGSADALNVANYRFAIVAPGVGQAPTPVGVESTLVAGPAFGPVASAQWATDVHVDRQLIASLTYRVIVRDMRAAAGDILGYPVSADFPGVVPLRASVPPAQDLANIDLAGDPFSGAFGFTSAGDIGQQGGLAGLKKRWLRRMATPLDAFRHLRGYGARLPRKKPMSPRNLGAYKTNLLQQLKQEPEVAEVALTVTLLGGGAVLVAATGRTKSGLVLEVQATQTPDGRFTVGA